MSPLLTSIDDFAKVRRLARNKAGVLSGGRSEYRVGALAFSLWSGFHSARVLRTTP